MTEEPKSINNTVDQYFKNRNIEYREGTRLGDTVSILPDTLVITDAPLRDAALGVTPIYVTLSSGAPHRDHVPVGAFWMQLPSGACIFGTSWKSGETCYG